MSRPALEVADIFRDHGSAWRSANAGHVSLDQLKVMSAIERCRTAALGGHVAHCEAGPDRYVMMTLQLLPDRIAGHNRRWASAWHASACLMMIANPPVTPANSSHGASSRSAVPLTAKAAKATAALAVSGMRHPRRLCDKHTVRRN